MLDAPVSGSPSSVQQGKAAILVGGAVAAFERARPVLLDIAPRVTHLGDNGAGLVVKLASNLNLAVQMLAFSEGVLLAEKNGIPRSWRWRLCSSSALASPMLNYRGPFVLESAKAGLVRRKNDAEGPAPGPGHRSDERSASADNRGHERAIVRRARPWGSARRTLRRFS